ncbi:hypothetical protein I3760_05G055400 [Carya illinoinensis]|uniref:Armadillo repeat-containing protein 6 n=1 Tax=Carya illinoinensis TaxID=32201 RepID=A0A922EWA7_CARIL|nr:hypothetical protein I3760_05G055400 [Carya illinoinensis]KAG6711469.1 hypothetical protein I3842_05G054900 [Carya illinoinensis]
MGPKKKTVAADTGRTISQGAFDDLVKENIDDLGMDPAEALQDAIQTLTLQGVDLSGIVTCLPGEGSVKDNPVIQSLVALKQLDSDLKDEISKKGLNDLLEFLDKLTELCGDQGSGNAAIATRNGGVELLCSICSKIRSGCEQVLISALRALVSLLHDLQSTETFRASGGPATVVGILNDYSQNLDILSNAFMVVSAASTGNEIIKESFMELKIDELIMRILSDPHGQSRGSIQSIYDSIRVLLTPDDNRVVASQVYGYARVFAKIGVARALVDSLHAGLSSPGLVTASIALKAVAVNDEICKSIAESGGIDAVLQCIDDSGEQGNKIVARACCSLLSKLAGSDTNKTTIVEKGGMDRLIKLSARFSDDPAVLQEVMSLISVLSLRSPENAARAIEAGAGDLAIQAMEKFPTAQQMQRNSCLMIRNLVVRNPENRTLLLSHGIEKYLRGAKQSHESCKDAASDALRDLGLDNYNL